MVNCLNIYISEFVDKMDIKKIELPEGIKDISHVINFNYTDTFYSNYSDLFKKDKNSYNIHGRACVFSDRHNIIMGVKEDSFDLNNKENTDYIRFQKFFQRIKKGTGARYVDWYNKSLKYDVFIMGHSLDGTDKEVLNYIIKHEKTRRIVIYYHSYDALNSYIKNMVDNLGRNIVISLSSERINLGNNSYVKKLEFVQLKK